MSSEDPYAMLLARAAQLEEAARVLKEALAEVVKLRDDDQVATLNRMVGEL